MIRIVQGNDVNLHVPFVEKDAEGHVTAVDFSNITNLAVSLSKGSAAFTDFTYYTVNNTVVICLNENAPRGSYNIMITAKNNGVDICYNANSAFEIVRYNAESTYVDYIADEDVTINTALFVASIINDAEITELREELQNKIAETESAKEAYEEKSSNLTAVAEVVEDIPDIAKQGDDPEATNTAILKAIGDIEIDDMATETAATANKNEILSAIEAIPTPEGMATEANLNAKSADILTAISDAVASILGTDTTATLTAIKSAISGIDFSTLATEANATSNKEAILTAIGQIDFSALAKQGSDDTATNTAILSAIRNIVLPPNIAEKSDIADAVTALKGNDTTQTLTALATAIENIPSPVDYATETNATANKTALQGTDPTATLTNILVAIADAVATLRGTDTNASLTGLTAWEQATDTDINNLFE